ncbi:hypothetical protein R3P38DRAFT_2785725 [Favolaschia claudopus]|uniref:Uncharacterized protein n=1 Tax=Favolaschia claudopus TaxID=2862362 RepID=A0AAW0ASN3_9AGAR
MPSTDEWNLRDQVAGAIVFQNVVHPKAHGLSATSPSSEMWALLYAKFMRTSEALKGDLEFMPIILASLPAKEFAQSVLMWQGSDQPGALSSALMHYWELTYKADMEKAAKEKEGGAVANAMAAAVGGGKDCGICHRAHITDNCWCRGGGKEGQAPGWWKASKGLEPREHLVEAAKAARKAKADVRAAAASTATTPKAQCTCGAHPAPAAAAVTTQFVSAMDYFDLFEGDVSKKISFSMVKSVPIGAGRLICHKCTGIGFKVALEPVFEILKADSSRV